MEQVYLVQRVIPMLPRLLCEDLCSLNPGVPRLAFSVIMQPAWCQPTLKTKHALKKQTF